MASILTFEQKKRAMELSRLDDWGDGLDTALIHLHATANILYHVEPERLPKEWRFRCGSGLCMETLAETFNHVCPTDAFCMVSHASWPDIEYYPFIDGSIGLDMLEYVATVMYRYQRRYRSEVYSPAS